MAQADANGNKEKALQAALSQIERQFGKGSMMRLGDREQLDIPSISTGSLGLDIALGIGGLPRGRIVEIYGPESPARPRSRSRSSPRPRRRVAPAPSSTPSTRSIRSTPSVSAWTSRISSSPSPTPVNRRSRSAT
jgi:hypothetical protein